MNKLLNSICVASCLLLLCTSNTFAMSAFPGAQGFGSQTVGGRGGTIINVTNLNDDGVGSLRYALSASGPRIVVFKVGGLLTLTNPIYINNPFITIAGQTAPGNGFAVRGGPVLIRTHDVIVRGMKFRIGDGQGVKPSERDGLSLWGDNSHEVYNVVIDHNSVAWGVDENMSTWDDTVSGKIHDVTFSNNIIAEALYNSIHVDEGATAAAPHSMGLLIGEGTKNVSVYSNLFASNYDRNPAVQENTNVELINNVVYNWGIHPFSLYGGRVNAINNIFKNTAGSSDWVALSGIHCEGQIEKIYESGNTGPGGNDWDTTVCTGNLESTVKSTSPVFTGSVLNIVPTDQTSDFVLANSGAIRDEVDLRIVDYVKKGLKPGTGWRVNSQNEVGGWPTYPLGVYPVDNDNDSIPDSWEQQHGGNLQPLGVSPAGYTWIEEYVNSIFSQPSNVYNDADLEPDGDVDYVDFNILFSNFNSRGLTGWIRSDIIKDGVINIFDFNKLITSYGL